MSDAVSKVTAGHLRRQAYLYVRQSTLYQVANNTEARRPPTGKASSTWSPRCRWVRPESCSAWNAPG
jgi:hypothetical protein